jgi:hypothetical protein
MPNHVVNEIIFRDVNPDTQEIILKKLLCSKGFVDFNILVPRPLNIWQGNIGEKEEKTFGEKTWYTWNVENWGTKWNAYGMDEDGKSVIRTEDTLTVIFQTAWSPPMPWVIAVFNATGLPFEHNWMSEGENESYSYKFFFSGGGVLRSPTWSGGVAGKEMYRHLHVLLWGCEPENITEPETSELKESGGQ